MADDADLPATRADLDDLPTWSIIRAARGFEQILGDVLAPCELTPVQFGALAHLSIASSLTQSQLAHRVLMRPQSANHLLDTLIDRGLVERTGERGSGRPNPVRLTPAGRELLAQAWPLITAANDPAFLGIEPHELRQLHDVMRSVLEHQAGLGT